MAYTRLLRAYYHTEKAIPEGQQYRLAKASTPAQRRAVDAVLAEFFTLVDGAWHQKRADAEILRYLDKQSKAKASANARWSKADRNANASPDAMRTHSEGNAHQTPDTRHHTRDSCSDTARASAPPEVEGHTPTPAGIVCRAMRSKGLGDTNPGDPRLLALLAQGATVEEFEGAATEAVKRSKGFAYALAALTGKRNDAAALKLAPTVADLTPWYETRKGIEAKGVEVGLGPWDEQASQLGRGPLWIAYRAAVFRAAGHVTEEGMPGILKVIA